MGKRSRHRAVQPPADEAPSPRQPCPCGSGRRYKACHGRVSGAPAPFVARTFAGLPGECDWVAMREIVPAATATFTLRGDHAGDGGGRVVQACSLLPMAAPALVRADGAIWLGLQVTRAYGDVSRDRAEALRRATTAEPGSRITLGEDPGPGPRLQDLVDLDGGFEVRVHDGYEFWLADVPDPSPDVEASLQVANDAASPTRRLEDVGAAYWTRMSGREYLRWVLPYEEDAALDGLARLHASGTDTLVEGSRLIGAFRAHGLFVPVWEVPGGTGAEALQQPARALHGRLEEAVTSTAVLDAGERSARAGIANRQITIR